MQRKGQPPDKRIRRARQMRSNPSVAEEIVWKLIRRSSLGFKFRRQVVLDAFTVDFYCPQLKFVLEMDGEQHDSEADAIRDARLNSLGYEVFRIPNRSFFQIDLDKTDWLGLVEKRLEEKAAEMEGFGEEE